MDLRNHSTVTEFILLGLSANPHTQALLFVLFLGIYLLTIMGNLMMLLVIKADSHLHTPMYFFLSHLSFVDICFSSVTVPKMLENLLSRRKTISVEGCLAQVFFVFVAAGTEACLLSVMAYDRYAAICHPLLYGQIMSKKLYIQLVWGSWGLGFLDALINIFLAVNMIFCEAKIIPHYSCEMPSLLSLQKPHCLALFHSATWAGNLPFGLPILCPHYHHHPEHQLYLRQKQGLLHLLFPPHCSDTVLWLRFAPPSYAKFRIPCRTDLLCAVYCHHAHAESPHLQSEKQGGEGGSEKNFGKVFAAYQVLK